MSVSVNPPKTPVTEGSSGVAIATLPNICKMPGPPAPFVPAPLPNIGKSGDSSKGYSKKVKIKGKKVAITGASFKSMGDMASKGTGGGILSSNTHGPCKFISPGSMDVKFEGKNVHLLTDMVTNNGGPSGSPPNSATMMGVLQLSGLFVLVEKSKCPICHKEHKELAESGKTKNEAQNLSKEYHPIIVEALKMLYDKCVHLGQLSNGILPESVMEDLQKERDRIKEKTMLGVLRCQCKNHLYANQSGATGPHLVKAADNLGMKHLNVGKHFKKNDIKDAITKRHGEKVSRNAFRRIEREMRAEQKPDRNNYNAIGNCAAPSLIILCYDDKGYPKEITERWYSHEWPKPPHPRNKMGKKYTYKETKRDEHGRKTTEVVSKDFKSGETVPPCGTCEILLPILMCPEPGKAKCTH